jgi:hypothetical protein
MDACISPSAAIPAEVYILSTSQFRYRSVTPSSVCATEKVALEGILIDTVHHEDKTQQQRNVMSRRCSTLHRIEEKVIHLDFLSAMSNVQRSL